MKSTIYVLINRMNKKFCKLDEASGGYPTDTDQPYDAERWNIDRPDEIANYIRMFPEYSLVRVDIDYTYNGMNVTQPEKARIDYE